jgi:DNA-binding GntR family transcriptional regulator
VHDLPLSSTLDRATPIPLYHQIATHLEQLIAVGKLPAGAFLPSESQLAGQWRVSIITIRRATQMLVESGLLVRRRGIGTQIATSPLPRRGSQTSQVAPTRRTA